MNLGLPYGELYIPYCKGRFSARYKGLLIGRNTGLVVIEFRIIRYQRIKNIKITLVETDSEEKAVRCFYLVEKSKNVNKMVKYVDINCDREFI
ncbi:hypothetical protein [Owenweeksia hongkongensis]|uniref:hypothetical protein n=1 Tax=Owenweeksia hongkongensis TaxID=253245 RepID=UPI003A951AF9